MFSEFMPFLSLFLPLLELLKKNFFVKALFTHPDLAKLHCTISALKVHVQEYPRKVSENKELSRIASGNEFYVTTVD